MAAIQQMSAPQMIRGSQASAQAQAQPMAQPRPASAVVAPAPQNPQGAMQRPATQPAQRPIGNQQWPRRNAFGAQPMTGAQQQDAYKRAMTRMA